jgi:hypothetical protein
MRSGKLNDSRWTVRMKGEGFLAEQLRELFNVARRKAGFAQDIPPLSTAAFRVPTDQLMLFESTARGERLSQNSPLLGECDGMANAPSN